MISHTMMLQAEGGSSLGQFFPFIAIIVVFYFFMILPQSRRKKRKKSSLERVLKEDQK